ncbi:cytochrome c maturation protein CcmE [Amycolatopsis saalfeldensis]|uniref:Cytochrome c-type biogenesis protein CcmE n=1 Tax=Amycolatopsis saalfeldensis TaxID=394193 RepID=A0A1H8YN02_9PSEU|nr:cytochrome c maturation protein CcmE [Amycolatopsis saalfeldensis]SEP53536.1 cytochrome c-type biogenesis protein CcmE [Amycolatopsis saalfeldensis]
MKRYRLLAVSGIGIVAVLVGVLLFGNLNGNLVYYLTPAEAIAKHADYPDGRRFQLGGFVEPGSVTHTPEGLRFVVSSDVKPGGPAIAVLHTGPLAQLFQPGIGVIVEGSWRGKDFVSDTMIVKHDANYRPPASKPSSSPGGDPR